MPLFGAAALQPPQVITVPDQRPVVQFFDSKRPPWGYTFYSRDYRAVLGGWSDQEPLANYTFATRTPFEFPLLAGNALRLATSANPEYR